MPLDLFPRARAQLCLLVGEVAREQRAEGFACPLARFLLLGGGIAAQRAGRENVFCPPTGLAQLERADGTERELAGLATEVVQHDPLARAASAHAHTEAGKVV